MKAAPVKTDCESLGNEFMNGVFFSAHVGFRDITPMTESQMEEKMKKKWKLWI